METRLNMNSICNWWNHDLLIFNSYRPDLKCKKCIFLTAPTGSPVGWFCRLPNV